MTEKKTAAAGATDAAVRRVSRLRSRLPVHPLPRGGHNRIICANNPGAQCGYLTYGWRGSENGAGGEVVAHTHTGGYNIYIYISEPYLYIPNLTTGTRQKRNRAQIIVL